MIILEPKPESSSQPTPPSPSADQPPSYHNVNLAGGSQPRVTLLPVPPPPIVNPGTVRSMSATRTPREEALIGEEYKHQLLARCARGDHDPKRHYGAFGIVFAVILFPIGLLCLALDSERTCERCGVRIE